MSERVTEVTGTPAATLREAASRMRALTEAATIDGFPDYEVRSDGTVWSSTNWRGYGKRQITPVAGRSGYLKVRLVDQSGRRRNRAVHRLVAEAFLGFRGELEQVRHLNGIKTDNRATNLAYGSAADNAADRDMHGSTARGERNGWATINAEVVREVRRLRTTGLLYREVAEAMGISQYHARKIATREVWAHVE